MRKWMEMLAVLVLLALLASTALTAPRYTITAIGPLAGDTRSSASAISESGRIAGLSFTAGGMIWPQWPPLPDTTLAFVWDRGILTPLLPPTGYQGSWAYVARTINENGLVVGTVAQVDFDRTGEPGWQGHPLLIGKNPVLWNRQGTPTLLPLPAGYMEGSAWAINNRGQVVGWAGNDLGLNAPVEFWMTGIWEAAVLWDKDGKTRVLPGLAGSGPSVAFNINDAGQIIGASSAPDLGVIHAALWDRGKVTDLTPGELVYSDAAGINNQGQVVVNSSSIGAFLWEKGRVTSLGVLENDVWNWAMSINDKGQVVGFSSGPEGAPNGRPFLWERGQMVDLNAAFEDPQDEWRLDWAYSINNRGAIVGVGFRKDANGQEQVTGFLLTPKP
ncbi:MAG: hypothetical protein IT210_08940 [Armatimonadetes bacterium]|nr:hypothetical protein [Armatimonadota bacterium]